MVNTNTLETLGGAITLNQLAGGDPAGMVLVSGPIFWDQKQNNEGSWLGVGPAKVVISVALKAGDETIEGTTGVIERGPMTVGAFEPTPWAIEIPVEADGWEKLVKASQNGELITVFGLKEYPDFTGARDRLDWHESLPVVRAR